MWNGKKSHHIAKLLFIRSLVFHFFVEIFVLCKYYLWKFENFQKKIHEILNWENPSKKMKTTNLNFLSNFPNFFFSTIVMSLNKTKKNKSKKWLMGYSNEWMHLYYNRFDFIKSIEIFISLKQKKDWIISMNGSRWKWKKNE